tara:strand:+ start:4310 stop:4897 length:588 start_codon:yes stop_codon:yes gene_type:complete
MGAHDCYQHPGCILNGRWTCCGQKPIGMKFSNQWELQSKFNCSINMPPYPPPPKRRGCQKCDHRSDDTSWTFNNTVRLHDIAGLIPFMNKALPIEGRPGFTVVGDAPVLLRCAPTTIKWFPPPAPEVQDDETGAMCKLVRMNITLLDLAGKQRTLTVYDAAKRLRIQGTLQKVDHVYDAGTFVIVVACSPRDFIV